MGITEDQTIARVQCKLSGHHYESRAYPGGGLFWLCVECGDATHYWSSRQPSNNTYRHVRVMTHVSPTLTTTSPPPA